MYRRVGGVPNIELSSPTDTPPDNWDLLDLINLDFTSTYNAPCLREYSNLKPDRMKPNKTAPATLAIGSTSWMEEETKPVISALESLREINYPGGISLESLLAERGLNTPPPLPLLSDLSDFIPNEEKSSPKQEEEIFYDQNGHSPLRDTSVENTVNLRELFSLHDTTGLDGGLNPGPQGYLTSEEKYLPAVCGEEELIESAEQQLSPANNSFVDQSSDDIITLSEEDFNSLAANFNFSRPGGQVDLDLINSQSLDLDLIQEANHVLAGVNPVQIKPARRGTTEQKKSSTNGCRKRRIASLDKDSDEYKEKRSKNNESVRRSRDKAKQRQEETEIRMLDLSNENKRLVEKVETLEKELKILRGLFNASNQR